MRRKSCLIFVLCLLAGLWLAPNTQAHEPRIVTDNQLILIENPEVSQAFYGELKGREAYYLIDLKQAQDLYFSILAPDAPGALKDKSVDIEYLPELGAKAENFARLDSAAVEWQKFYEEFAGDNYFKGPELKKAALAGYYVIKVSSPDNEGKYVLVVGEKEEFPVVEIAKALITVPRLKKDFFQEPVIDWFHGRLGKYAGGGLIALIILGLAFHRFNKAIK